MRSIAILSGLELVCVSLLALMFALSTAHAANEGCRIGPANGEQLRLPSLGLKFDSSPASQSVVVLDKTTERPADAMALNSLLAWHCQAVSDVSLGSSMRPYRNAACAEGGPGVGAH